ncbi:transcription factor S [Candidatus Pacearchaeota archaeon RBG_13_36_9]|nr:MAG: transcription factor S [Candidatus Pacearchaeota archaeon RBG_13_36_9]HJX49886.1 transcription factor S [Candidatus Nanoarchaeia archaeon]
MEFCPKCGGLLMNKEKNSSCLSCGYVSDSKISLESTEKGKLKAEVDVVDDDASEVNPIIQAKCQKCNNNQAYFWILQTRAGDEASTRFFKCTKCKHVWREYK